MVNNSIAEKTARLDAACEEALKLLPYATGDISGLIAIRHDITHNEAIEQVRIARDVLKTIQQA